MVQARKTVDKGFAISDDSQLGRAFNRGQLNAGSRRYTAWQRYAAGREYQRLWAAYRGGSSGLPHERVNNSLSPGGEAERMLVAKDLLEKLPGRLSPNAQFVLGAFLVEGETGSEAVNSRLDGAEKSVWVAICLYLDDLIDAMRALEVGRVREVSCATDD